MSQRAFARKRFNLSALAAVAIIAPFASAQGLSVNGPLELTETIRNLQAEAKPAVPDQPDLAESATLPRPASESKPLGLGDRASANSEKHESADAQRGERSWDPTKNEIVRVFGALAAVIGLVLMLRVCIRRFGGDAMLGGRGAARPSGVVEILARYPLSRGQQLVVLKMARRILLLHQSGTAVTALAEVTDHQEVAALLARMEAGSSERNAAKFRNTLAEFMHESPTARAGERHVPGKTVLPRGEAEIIDLTRMQGGFFKSLFAGRGA